MKKAWRVILVIVAIAITVGAVCAGVGMMTGADTDRIGTILEERIAEQYNLDAHAFIHDWIPEAVHAVQEGLS